MAEMCRGCANITEHGTCLLLRESPAMFVEQCPAFEKLLAAVVRRTMRTGVTCDKEDLAQEVRVRLLHLPEWPRWHSETFDDFASWLATVTRNAAIDWGRRHEGVRRRHCRTCESWDGAYCRHPQGRPEADGADAPCEFYSQKGASKVRLSDELLHSLHSAASGGLSAMSERRDLLEVVTASLARLAADGYPGLLRGRLLFAHYITGKTLRELAKDENVAAASLKRYLKEGKAMLRSVIEKDLGLACEDLFPRGK